MNGAALCFPVFLTFSLMSSSSPTQCDFSVPYRLLLDLQRPLSLACLSLSVSSSGRLHPFVFISYWSTYISVYIHGGTWDPRSRSQQRNEGRVSAEDCPGYLVICLPRLIIFLSAKRIQFYRFNSKKASCRTPFFNYFESLVSIVFWKVCLLFQPGDQY